MPIQVTPITPPSTPSAPAVPKISADQIKANAAAPKLVTIDGQTAEQHSIPDQIAADRYSKAQAASTNPAKSLRFAKIVPPGTA